MKKWQHNDQIAAISF